MMFECFFALHFLLLLGFLHHQAQHSHHVIQQVLNHLDNHNKDTPRARAGIVQVLLETVAIAAKGSVGELKKIPRTAFFNT